MPSVSDKQHRAMEAAAHGHSTLGIPEGVGKDYVAADEHKATGGTAMEFPDHFHVKGPGGEFKVSKHGLHPATIRHLRTMCTGGAAMADGGAALSGDMADANSDADESPSDPNPVGEPSTVKKFAGGGQILTSPQPTGVGDFSAVHGNNERSNAFMSGAPGSDPSIAGNIPEAPNYADETYHDERTKPSNTADLKRADDSTQSAESDAEARRQAAMLSGGETWPGPNDSMDPSKTNLFGPAATQVPGAALPQPSNQPDTTQDPMQQLTLPTTQSFHPAGPSQKERDLGAEVDRRTEEQAKNTENYNNERNQIQAWRQKQEEQSHAVYQAKYDQIDKDTTTLHDDILNTKIDPDQYWAKRGTAGKISGIIGLLLSGFGSGLARNGTPNLALKVIQENINREIDSQKENLSTKKSMLSDLYRKSGDLRMAEMETRMHYNTIVASQLEQAANNHSSAAVKTQAAQMIAMRGVQYEQEKRAIANLAKQNDVNASNFDANRKFQLGMAQAAAAGAANAALKAPREAQGRYISQLQATQKDADQLLQHNTKEGISGFWGGLLDRLGVDAISPALSTAKGMSGALIEKGAAALSGLGASKERMEHLEGFRVNPWDTHDVQAAKIAGLKSYLQNQLDFYGPQQAGVGFRTGPGVPTTPVQQGPKGDDRRP